VMLAAALVWAWGCAAHAAVEQPRQFVSFNHVAAVGQTPGYDAVFYPRGEIDFYPNRDKPRRAVVHRDGGIAEFACLNDACTDYTVGTSGIPGVADTSLELTEISKGLLLVRNGDNGATRGYLADAGKNQYRFFESLNQAQQAVNRGSGDGTGVKVGKVILEVVLVAAVATALVAVAVLGASGGGESSSGY